MKAQNLKFVFAPLGVAIGITVFVAVGVSFSRAVGLQDVVESFGSVPFAVSIGLGLIFIVLFFPMFVAGIHFLGRRGAVGQSETLKTEGIYRYLRNPIYIGASMTITGTGFVLVDSGVVIAGLLWLALTTFQCKREENELLGRFGKKYEEYKRRTPMMFPDIKSLRSDMTRRKNK